MDCPPDVRPVEHEIRIENLDEREIWIPMQDSLAFDWQIDPKAPLRQLFVEKGANTPSSVGTHQVAITNGYHWTGTASTYGDIDEKEPREIIPWTLVSRNYAPHSGWYAGIEFSGRTRISLTREKESLKEALGLNPDPAPFRTRLAPGEVFESPVIFLGGILGQLLCALFEYSVAPRTRNSMDSRVFPHPALHIRGWVCHAEGHPG